MSIIAVHGPNTWGSGGSATAGSPGTTTGGTPANFQTLQAGWIASPLTAWTTGQRIVLMDTTLAYWNGTAWVVGTAP